MKFRLFTLMSLVGLTACISSHKEDNSIQTEAKIDKIAMKELQGVWLDSYTETPVMRVHDDSICFVSHNEIQMPFIIRNDSLVILTHNTVSYPLLKRTADFISFINSAGDKISLIKSQDESINSMIPDNTLSSVPQSKEVVKKDSVLTYKNERYRGYTSINPTSIKIVRTGITEDGFAVDNIYYDNIIHICVYKGKKRLCGKDIKREHFKDVIPGDFLNSSILSDMEFIGISEDGYIFMATVCQPDGPCYNIELSIDEENNVDVKQGNWE